MIKKKNVFISLIGLLFISLGVLAQDTDKSEIINKQEAKLIESSPYQTSELASLFIDMLGNEMRKNSNSKGLIIIYCGKHCQYGEVEAHLRGLNVSLMGKGVKMENFITLQGGFREKLTVEYWLIPENACLPIPNSTVDIEKVKFKGNFKGKAVAYDCC